jgi:predicted alpha/beta hydrolase family esterase
MKFLFLYVILHALFTIYCISLRVLFNQQPIKWSVESLTCEIKEFVAVLLVIPLSFGWFPSLPPRNKHHKSSPIIFLPGYALNKTSFWPLKRYLQTLGWKNLWAINHPVLKDDPVEFINHINRCIDDMHWRTGKKVILIGHSMGGIIANDYLHQFGNQKVKALVTIGTPWKGSHLRLLGFGKQLKLLAPNKPPPKVPTIPHLSIWSSRDWITLPTSSCVVEGFQCKEITSAGHMSMLFSLEVFKNIKKFLHSIDIDE